jgi:DNA invertase Pin-like site-specific DNA recombinase
MLVGYMRVSKTDGSQVNDLQRDALLAAGIDNRHLYEDAASGKRDDRSGLAACLKALREGDTLIVWKLDRLGRDLRHLVNTVHDLTARGIGFKVLSGHGASIDTTSPSGKLVFGIFAALAEFERELIIERTKAGMAAARARGRNGGSASGGLTIRSVEPRSYLPGGRTGVQFPDNRPLCKSGSSFRTQSPGITIPPCGPGLAIVTPITRPVRSTMGPPHS